MNENDYEINDTYADIFPFSQCMECNHLMTMGHCKAYPLGIPMSLWRGTETHNVPREGDRGILFEPLKFEETI